jgi:hypothetical protein
MTVIENPDGSLTVTFTAAERDLLRESGLGATPAAAVEAQLRSVLSALEGSRRRRVLEELQRGAPNIPTDELDECVRGHRPEPPKPPGGGPRA